LRVARGEREVVRRRTNILKLGSAVKTACLLLIALQAATVHAASIGLFSDPGCGSCNLVIPAPGASATLYVKAVGVSVGEFCGGLDGAEFRVVGLPQGWSAVSTPSPAALASVGDPFGDGVGMGFFPPLAGDCILLFTVVITGDTSPALLQVVRHAHPSNPSWPCPNLRPGDPCGGRICVGGGSLLVNSGTSCTVGVGSSIWSQVKRLYK
jgi:hypothetical protein